MHAFMVARLAEPDPRILKSDKRQEPCSVIACVTGVAIQSLTTFSQELPLHLSFFPTATDRQSMQLLEIVLSGANFSPAVPEVHAGVPSHALTNAGNADGSVPMNFISVSSHDAWIGIGKLAYLKQRMIVVDTNEEIHFLHIPENGRFEQTEVHTESVIAFVANRQSEHVVGRST